MAQNLSRHFLQRKVNVVMRPFVEQLEKRLVMATGWHNAVVPYDVDGSNTVQASDVLLVVADLKTKGVRTLGIRPAASTEPLCDVNNDNRMTAQDALLVVAGLKNYLANALSIEVGLDANSDLNGNQVVLKPQVTYRGTTLPYTTVRIEALRTEAAEAAEPGLAAQTVVADGQGKFQFQLTLSAAINHLKFTARDPRARTQSTERVLRLGDVVAEWNAELLEAVRETTAPSSVVPGLLIKPPPPLVAKQLAMLHTAMFDAINAISHRYTSYALNIDKQTGASEIAAAATAAHRVASALYDLPFHIAKWDLTLAESMATIADGPAKTLGIEVGRQAADAILAMRANDGSASTWNYVSQNLPGTWRPTLPDFAPPTLPQWPHVTPFVMEWAGEYRPEAPPDLSSADYAAAVDQVMRLGAATSSERTADQTVIAGFWADGGGTVTPPGHWNSIAMDVVLAHSQPLIESARTLALLNLALADAGIASWDAKYAYDLWRPLDAIRQADTDGNLDTVANAAWTHLLGTPSFPSYTSGHSTFSAAAAAVLTAVYGDGYAFTTQADKGSTGQWPPADDVSGLAQRSFSSFQAAAQEAGMSRIYGGIHYNFDNTAGLMAGQAIGELVTGNALKPVSAG